MIKKTVLCLSVIVGSIHSSPTSADQALKIASVIDSFAGKGGEHAISEFDGPVRVIRDAEILYFGVHQNQQNTVDFASFKQRFMQERDLTNPRFIQIVGDSKEFSQQSTEGLRSVMAPHLAGSHMIEYGYTGYLNEHQLDVNSTVNEYLNNDPTQADRVLANVVGHTVVALSKWGCKVSPHVKNFMVVYNKNGTEPGFTQFGDDVTVSDCMLSPQHDDRVICLEGGIQSFNQSCRSLREGIPVSCYTGLRTDKGACYFSTSRFFERINNKHKDENRTLTHSEVQQVFDDYNSTLKSPWDETRPDAATKKRLFEEAIGGFVEDGVYEKIPTHCSFEAIS